MQLTVMTFNLRYDKPDPGDTNWQIRKSAIAQLVKHYHPDLIGTQEGKAHQLLDLHRLLPNYQSVGRDRLANGTDEHCAIFYHSQHLTCLETADFYLSDTPDIPGSITPSWENPLPRMATWGKFHFHPQSTDIILLNTHFEYKSGKARENSAQLIQQRLQQIQSSEAYLLITGDFNTQPNNPARNILHQTLQDALKEVPDDQQKTYHEFTGKAFAAVDTIYYDNRLQLETVNIDQGKWEEVFPSDHFPVIATFSSRK